MRDLPVAKATSQSLAPDSSLPTMPAPDRGAALVSEFAAKAPTMPDAARASLLALLPPLPAPSSAPQP